MTDAVFSNGSVAVVTGAASGIGLAATRAFLERGMTVTMVDLDPDKLDQVSSDLDASRVMTRALSVDDPDGLASLADEVIDRFGHVDLLMNNAAAFVAGGSGKELSSWHKAMDVNFWGAVYGERAFRPHMETQDRPSAIVNTGSKQGITNPPGNLIYNVTKSALKTYTEGLQHELRNTPDCLLTAHLLVPGWTTTGDRDPNPGAWTARQVADRMIDGVSNGDFYIICPDNEVTPEMDAKRMLWAAGDIIENRPPLSRWHADWADKFKAT